MISGNPVTSPGRAIDVAAPGVGIYSTWMRGGYNTASGTSMAAPHAAGVFALYMAGNHLKPTNAAGVYAVRQAVIDAGQGQNLWRQDGNTRDPDGNRERLAYVGQTASPPSPPAPGSPSAGISPPALAGKALAGNGVVYTYTVTNTGGATGTFTATTSSVWNSSPSPASFSLSAGAWVQVTVTHAVPAGSAPGSSDAGRLTVATAGSSASAAFTTTARGYAVTVTPANQSANAPPGGTASYTYSVKNTGTEPDAYSLAALAGWAASVAPASLALAAGQTASVTVSHVAPASVSGATDTGTLTAGSSSSGARATASFSTTAQAAPGSSLNVAVRISGAPRPGSIFPVTVVVTDSLGNPVPSAQVTVKLLTGGGRTYTANRTTGSSGAAGAWFWTWSSDYFPWTITAQATKNGVSGSAKIVYPSQ